MVLVELPVIDNWLPALLVMAPLIAPPDQIQLPSIIPAAVATMVPPSTPFLRRSVASEPTEESSASSATTAG